MYNAEVKRGSYRGGRINRGFRGGYRSHYKEEDKDEYFVPQEDSKWSKYKTQWWYRYEN